MNFDINKFKNDFVRIRVLSFIKLEMVGHLTLCFEM